MLRRENALGDLAVWPAIRRAAAYIVKNGPSTKQDRWEEDGGYSPFTLAVVIAGLIAAAGFAERAKEPEVADYLRETADEWNDQIERWTYVTKTPLAAQVGVDGYYVRIAPARLDGEAGIGPDLISIKNRPGADAEKSAAAVISPDALALVRFGLRSASDSRIVNTVKAIDALLKTAAPAGPMWHRYNDDGYGEHADGQPFDGTGIGRGWPLLGGERAHYELAAGRDQAADQLRQTMESQAGTGGFFPEQVWDSADLPERNLTLGRPSGSAMPLVWAHAEYVKLLRSLRDRRVFDLPPATAERYQGKPSQSPHRVWRFSRQIRALSAGKRLRVETLVPARIHWSADGWKTSSDTDTRDPGLGVSRADLSASGWPAGTEVVFTFYWPKTNRWEGVDFRVRVG